jgi:hypothetical protein
MRFCDLEAHTVTDHVLAALVRRRAELSGRMKAVQGELQQMHADLASLDAVIRQLDPEYKLDTIRPKYQRSASGAESGSMSRTVLDVLRCSLAPMPAKDIAAQIIEQRGLNMGDRALARNMAKRVDMALRYQRTNGMVRETEGPGAGVVWEIAG